MLSLLFFIACGEPQPAPTGTAPTMLGEYECHDGGAALYDVPRDALVIAYVCGEGVENGASCVPSGYLRWTDGSAWVSCQDGQWVEAWALTR